ncbi:MAG: hypothetical protein AABX47_10000 [Nanoarchaeota archaeon]
MRARMPSEKKGQLTVYIIVAILVISVFAVLRLQQDRTVLPPTTGADEIQKYLDVCFQRSAASSLLTIEQEGSGDRRMGRIPHEDYDVAILVQGDQVLIPSIESLEKDIASELISSYSECNPSLLFPYAIKQDFDSAQASVTLTDSQARFVISVPSSMRLGDREITSFGQHTVSIPTNLAAMHKAASALAESIIGTPDMIPLNELDMPPFEAYVYPTDDKNTVIRIIDNDPATYLGEDAQTYTFGVAR